MRVDVLVLDDLGAENLTAWASEQLFVLLNARYLAEQAMVLTSNGRPEALPAPAQPDHRTGADHLDADQRLSAAQGGG